MKTINFIPVGYARVRAARRATFRGGLLLITAAAMVAWWFASSTERLETLDRELAVLDAEVADVIDTTAAVDTSAATDDRNAVKLIARLRPEVPTTSILDAAAAVLPRTVGITAMSFESAPAEPVPVGPNGKRRARRQTKAVPTTLILEGLAPDDITIAQVIGGLDEQGLFVNVKLGFSRPVDGGDLVAREFQITADIPTGVTYVLDERTADAD